MKNTDKFVALYFFIIIVLSFIKVSLVFEYKRNFNYLDSLQEKIYILQDQNTKLDVEIALVKSSPFIYEEAINIGMVDPDAIK
tara:strand:+ start:1391 stop:1639 length:249 start_codon:yes stop_codon:yes gene_type:complete